MKKIIALALAVLMVACVFAGCSKKNISFEKGVKDLHVCLEDQIVSIKYDASKTSEETLKAAIEKLGYPVNGKAEHGHSHQH